jgi:hypothetical protein
MKRTAYFGIGMASLLTLSAGAQDQTDALRYSQLSFGGTARFMAMGGAFTAVGGDASSLTFNPAGIAVFNKSQLTFSPGFTIQTTGSAYNGTTLTTNQPSLNIQNAAWIATWKNKNKDAMWRGINFGIAYNRTANFNSFVNTQGTSNTSLLDEFVANANGNTPDVLDPFSTQQAFNAGGLIDTIKGEKGTAYSNVVDPFLANGKYVLQQQSLQTWGSMGETDISFGGDYKNKLYIGASIGIPDINYNANASYTESPLYNDTLYGLQSYNYTTTLNTVGAGINFKIGFIYRIFDWLRIGGAFHTPTWFDMTDNYSSYISATYNAASQYPAGTFSGTSDGNPVTGSYNYTLITPMRAMGGVAIVIRKHAILSADYEYVDYSTASLTGTDVNSASQFSQANAAIQQYFTTASNLRFGGELMFYPFSLRAGYTYYGNPYSSSAGNSTIKDSYCAGLGIRIRRAFIDFAYVISRYNENYYLYDPSLVNPVKNTTTVSSGVVTFGVNF